LQTFVANLTDKPAANTFIWIPLVSFAFLLIILIELT
jgi:hypothetical protein